jgi:hypothetical protein
MNKNLIGINWKMTELMAFTLWGDRITEDMHAYVKIINTSINYFAYSEIFILKFEN